jgi:hypothetical protein
MTSKRNEANQNIYSNTSNKKRKATEENRMFNPDWEHEFLFTMPDKKPVCLLCQNSIAVCKKTNLRRHYTSMHMDFEKSYPLGAKVREEKIVAIIRNLLDQQNIFKRLLTSKGCVTEASLKISWVLAKNQKPYSEGETVKQRFQECADSLFAEFKNKDEIKRRISDLQLSHQTVARRVELLSKDIFEQLCSDLKKASGFSLALDESCDVKYRNN